MAQDGDYPFFVNVWNRFENGSGVTLTVTFSHYYNGADPGGSPPPGMNSNEYEIHPGDMIAFPLYWANMDESGDYHGEYLEITMSNPPTDTDHYYVLLGPKANYEPDVSQSIIGVKPIPSGTGGKNSGIYEVPGNEGIGKITVKKMMHDPETDNVSIGPDIP